jgi:hypothetical protein
MAETKKGRGCFFYGCITTIVVGVLAVGVILGGMYFGLNYLKDTYTSATPIAVAPVTLTSSEGGPAVKRVEDFRKALENGQPMAPLELTGDELDYVVRNARPDIRDSMHLYITNDQIHAELSYPLEAITPRLAGRYLNGTAQAGLRLQNGAVVVDLKSIELNGQPAPKELVANLKAQGIEWKPKPKDVGADLVKNLEAIEIKDGKIILKPKNSAPAPATK